MDDFEEIEFVIPAYTPETMPLDRLLQYLKEIGEVVGLSHDMHLIKIERSSTRPVFAMPPPLARQARENCASIQRGEGTDRQRAAYRRIRQMVEKDSGAKPARLNDRSGVILDFPPLKAKEEISGVKQTTTVDGILLRAGGGGPYASILLQDLKGNALSGFSASKTVAKDMAKHLYEPIRVHGIGSWDRSREGQWVLDKMLIHGFETIRDTALVDIIKELQALPVSWPEDADDLLMAERGPV